MRGILALAIGAAMVAAAAGFLPPDAAMPSALRIILGLAGAVLGWAGLYHLRLRWRRHAAYRGGNERGGTATLEELQGEDRDIARIRFSTGSRSWRLTVDANSLPASLAAAGDEAGARGFLDNADILYALDVDQSKLLPISPGKEISVSEAPAPGPDGGQKV